MTLFWTGILIILLLPAFYMLLLRLKNRHWTRFRSRLTLLFLGFVLIPVIPLVFLSARLITQSADLLLMPGIGRALDTSLETLRMQMEDRGRRVLEMPAFQDDPSIQDLSRQQIVLWLRMTHANQNVELNAAQKADPAVETSNWIPDPSRLDSDSTFSILSITKEDPMMAVYRRTGNSTWAAVVYPISPVILQAKDEIERASAVYGSLSVIKESIKEKNLLGFLAFLLVLSLAVISMITARWISRSINEPIDSLVAGMKRAAAGDLSGKVKTRAKDEFRFLVDSFNRMMQELESSRRRLIDMERIAAWQDIARQISHEIKNSLTPLKLSLHRLRGFLNRQESSFGIVEILEVMEEELHSLEHMASEFSDFARLPRPQKEPVDLNELVRSAVLLEKENLEKISIHTRLNSRLPEIHADPKQIKRVLLNLIQNSIEASKSGQSIDISTGKEEKNGKYVILRIHDQGYGMNDETLKNCFRPNFTTKKQGLGLGLAIVRKIISDHNGDIEVHSRPRKGTRMIIRFPVSAD
ncbi:MAG TPA: HAMP domain-containing protein [bacterium]|nr:HAMP domain-containing protein [bacterium]